jgi:UDP-glucose 4-epimerase
MKILITGAAGFIGSHLAEQLCAAGHQVTGLDDLSTGRRANLAALHRNPAFTLVQGSILDAPLVDQLTAGTSEVYHLAAAVGAFVIRDHTLDALRTNIHGTENVVESAARHGASLLAASTSEIYGKNTTPGLTENADRIIGSPLKSRWSYAEAKAIDESLIHAYTQTRGLTAVIIRFFNTVGPRQTGRYGMVIPRLVAQALTGQPLTIYGTGNQIRCFCHINDITPALPALLHTPAALGRAINLGNTEQTTINNLAHRILHHAQSPSPLTHTPYLQAYGPGYEDMQRRIPDTTLAHTLTGYHPTHTLDTIIKDVIHHHQTTQHTALASS